MTAASAASVAGGRVCFFAKGDPHLMLTSFPLQFPAWRAGRRETAGSGRPCHDVAAAKYQPHREINGSLFRGGIGRCYANHSVSVSVVYALLCFCFLSSSQQVRRRK